jgi:hypothetical protein
MLFPAVTGLGLPEFVTLKSACVPDATAIVTVAELSAVFESCVALAPVTVSVIMVPAAVPAATLYTAVIVPVEPGGTLGFVQLTGPVFGQVHVPPPVVTAATETNVVFAGVGSVKVAVLQLLGPELYTVCV